MTASGIGSWPGTDVRSAIGVVQELLGGLDAASTGVAGLPYLPELPARGPGADMIGRSAALCAGMAIDLQPSGWRLVDHPGRDSGRAQALLRQDTDELAEAYDGYRGRLKVSFAGPWTLVANVRLPRGERVVGDLGACRDVAQSAAEGYAVELGRLRALVPGAEWVVQIDEPSLPSVLAGRLPTSSGYGRHRAIDEEQAGRVLMEFVDTLARATATGDESADRGDDARERIVAHCCAAGVPLELPATAGFHAVAVDTGLPASGDWERLAALLEAGRGVWAGLPVPATVPASGRHEAADLARPVERAWRALGLGAGLADRLTLTPACGLAGAGSQAAAVAAQRGVIDAAVYLHDVVHDS